MSPREPADGALRDSEERYRTLFEANPEPVFVYDVETLRFLEVNRATVDRYRYSRDEFLRMTVLDIRPEEDVGAIRARLSRPRSRSGQPIVSQSRHRRKDGSVFEVEVSSHELLFAGRSARLVMAHDLTERRRTEEERAKLILAVEQAAESIVMTDPDGTIVYVNPAFEHVSGYTREEAVGRNPRMLKSGQQGPEFYRDLWATLARGEVWRGRFVNRAKDGSLYEEEATLSPVRDAAGKLVAYVAVKRDVRRELRLEEQLRQSQKMQAVGRLAGGVAHDFNNLLNVISGYGELLLRQLAPPDPGRAKLEQILRAAKRAAGLTRQLLAFSRRQVLQPKVLDLNLVVADMEKMLHRLIGEDVDLVTRADAGLGCVKVDPGQIEQVIMNLAVNSRDAMPAGGRLSIETRNVELDEEYASDNVGVRPGRYVLLSVGDTGCGISDEVRAHLFEPFFTTKEQGKGTGLGLSTVYGIVAQSGGHIAVESEVGRGTRFLIYLPRAEEDASRDEADEAPPPARSTETILLVEDDEMVRETIQEALESNGHVVLAAASADEGVRIAESHIGPIHLLVTDVVMPRRGGRELAEALRRLRPDMRVLYVSGYPNDSWEAGGEFDARTFLSKPFTPDALLHKVREVLASPTGL